MVVIFLNVVLGHSVKSHHGSSAFFESDCHHSIEVGGRLDHHLAVASASLHIVPTYLGVVLGFKGGHLELLGWSLAMDLRAGQALDVMGLDMLSAVLVWPHALLESLRTLVVQAAEGAGEVAACTMDSVEHASGTVCRRAGRIAQHKVDARQERNNSFWFH